MFVENVIQTLSRGILSSFILVSLISPASTYPLHKQQLVKQESWQVITAICRVDFENRVRFFSDDAFRICSKESCPLTGEPGPFGDRCRPCCQNKANATTGENGEEGVKSSGEMINIPHFFVIYLHIDIFCILSLCCLCRCRATARVTTGRVIILIILKRPQFCRLVSTLINLSVTYL